MRLLLLACLVAPLAAAVSATPVSYAEGSTALEGALYVPADVKPDTPGVVVFPEWWGCNHYAKRRASELAERGYIAFAADMYGVGKVTTDPKQAGEWAGPFYKDRALLTRRAGAALTQLRAAKGVDATKVAAIGFCFGGTVGLEMARSGSDLRGVVSFHGGLKTGQRAEPGAIKAQVLVLHGGADPLVPPAEVAEFFDEMTKANATWRFEAFGGALHAFTNPDAAELHKILPPVDYSPDAERRSLAAAYEFLGEVLAR